MTAAHPSWATSTSAPGAPATFVELRRDGVALVAILEPGGSCSPLAPGFGARLAAAIDRIEDDAAIAAAVLTPNAQALAQRGLAGAGAGAGAGFGAGVGMGVDVDLLKSIKFASDAERLARDGGQLLRRIEQLRKPIVAALDGPVLGGAFELALACHALVAADDPQAVVGFPEVGLGLLPGCGGLLRVARRAGARVAIDLALGGKRIPAALARDFGLVDEVCPRALLLDVAARHAKGLAVKTPRPSAGRVASLARAVERSPLGRALLFRKSRERAGGAALGHNLAPQRALAVLERFAAAGFDEAADLEAKSFGELVVSEGAHRLLELALATATTTAAAPAPGAAGSPAPAEAHALSRVGVIGGGHAGSGIAFVTAAAGLSVRLKERDDATAGRALRRVHELAQGWVEGGTWSARDRDEALARVSAATDYSGLRRADLVIEAAFEDLAVKQAILRDLEGVVGAGCVLASTTSSIPVARVAEVARSPERVIGMHYFSPVAKMPLLEVARCDRTAAWAVAAAAALGRRQNKTVIVVKDGPGLYTTRILAPFLNEAARLLGEGVSVEAVDRAMTEWGFPVGPLRLLDEVGIDVGDRVAQELHQAFGERMAPARILGKLAAEERTGRKGGRGFYVYESPAARGGPRPRAVDPSVYALLEVRPTTALPIEEIQMRCALSMVNEAVRCVGEGIVSAPRDGDVGAVLGLGFPAFRGGPLRYVDTVGAAEALRRVQGYADRFGERWRPAPLLVHMARRGERFYA